MLHRDDHPCILGIDTRLVLTLRRLPQGVGQMVMVGQIELAAVADDHGNRVHQQIVSQVFLRLGAVAGNLVVDLVEAGRILRRLQVVHLDLAERPCRCIGSELR